MNALEDYDLNQDYSGDLEDFADVLLRLSFAASNYERLLKCLYGHAKLDMQKLQTIIKDLAMDLAVEVPYGKPTIARESSEKLTLTES